MLGGQDDAWAASGRFRGRVGLWPALRGRARAISRGTALAPLLPPPVPDEPPCAAAPPLPLEPPSTPPERGVFLGARTWFNAPAPVSQLRLSAARAAAEAERASL